MIPLTFQNNWRKMTLLQIFEHEKDLLNIITTFDFLFQRGLN